MAGKLYDVDFYEWTQRTAQLLRDGRLDEVDLELVAEEIADMGGRDRREVRSRLTVLLAHLLKWQMQPQRRSRSTWLATIIEQRQQLRLIFEQSPSLQPFAQKDLPNAYAHACKQALLETRLTDCRLPPECPFAWEQIMDDAFFPVEPLPPG